MYRRRRRHPNSSRSRVSLGQGPIVNGLHRLSSSRTDVHADGLIYSHGCEDRLQKGDAVTTTMETCGSVLSLNMTQQNQRISVECAITELLDTELGETMKDEIPMSAELVLELSCGKKSPRCGYYFAHTWSIERPHRLVFWAHDKPVDTIFEDWKQPVLSDAQLGTTHSSRQQTTTHKSF